MNINHQGSSADRFMNFSSFLSSTSVGASPEIFNNFMVFVPSPLATANIVDYFGTGITALQPIVKTVTADNYSDVLQGALLEQWSPVFLSGANLDTTIYLVVFLADDLTDLEVTDTSIKLPSLTKAFNDLYHIAFWKSMFSETYGAELTDSITTETYYDLELCLAYLCEYETSLSYNLAFSKFYLDSEGALDTVKNPCLFASADITTEKTNGKLNTDLDTRSKYFWGILLSIGGKRTWFITQSADDAYSEFLTPVIFALYFNDKNDSGTYIGNKLCKIRLTDSTVKPTGYPSYLDTDVNMNLTDAMAELLDSKNICYFLSISGNSTANAQASKDVSIAGYPVIADTMAKYVDYYSSQAIANLLADTGTLTSPVLANEATYVKIQNIVLANIQKFAGTGRITNIVLDFPSYLEAKQGNTFVGSGVWSAVYVGDLESVTFSGSVSF